jgi:hypothetical protein
MQKIKILHFALEAYKHTKQISCFDTCVKVILFPKKYVTDNCLVKNFTLQAKQSQIQVQNVLFNNAYQSECVNE